MKTHGLKYLSDGTLTKLCAATCGDARELDDGTWLPLVMEMGEWVDAPKDEPSHAHRLAAVMRSRELMKDTHATP